MEREERRRSSRLRRGWPFVALLLVTPAAAACPNVSGRADISVAEALLEIEDALVGLREESAILQAQIDSLREIVARQDTVLRRIGNLTGVPVPTR